MKCWLVLFLFWVPCHGAENWQPGQDWPHANVDNWTPIPIYWSTPANDGPVMLEPGQSVAEYCDSPVTTLIECTINGVRGYLRITGTDGGIRYEFPVTVSAKPCTWGALKERFK